MRIITISRQFGSGGRELGRRLSDNLGFDYYDKEIIQQLAEDKGLNPDYVSSVLQNHGTTGMRLSYRNSFSNLPINIHGENMATSLLLRQREIIENIAAAGNDCIIVGRDADIILREYRPMRIFVCADMDSRLSRCMAHEMKKEEALRLSEKEVSRNIRRIDQERSRVREMLTGMSWGEPGSFDLTVNAGNRDIKKLAEILSPFVIGWFEQNE